MAEYLSGEKQLAASSAATDAEMKALEAHHMTKLSAPGLPNRSVLPEPVHDPSPELLLLIGTAGVLFTGALIVGASATCKKIIEHFKAA